MMLRPGPADLPMLEGVQPHTLLPLDAWPVLARQGLLGVFTDIDDTLTTQGQITPDALQALADLQAAGLCVVAITGRPIGWCEAMAKGEPSKGLAPWPVDAVVAENGAVAWVGPLASRHKIYQQDAAVRARNRARNDVAMFEHFTHSVGVANIRRVAEGLSHLPRYITPSEHGAGFAEVVAAILAARA